MSYWKNTVINALESHHLSCWCLHLKFPWT